jgi:putative heme-binding domain-containing protein
MLQAALDDRHPMVRRAAVKLAEGRLNVESILSAIVGRAIDDSAAVRLQVACTLGESKDARVGPALARILATVDNDQFLTAAVLSSLGRENLDAAVRAAISRAREDEKASGNALELVSLAAAVGRDDLSAELFANIAQSHGGYAAWHIDAADRWLRAANARKKNVPQQNGGPDKPAQEVRRFIEPVLSWSLERAADPAIDTGLRAACLRLSLRNLVSRDDATELARTALGLQTPPEVQRVAVQELAALNLSAAGEMLLGGWRSFGPGVRQDVLSAALSRPALSEELLSRIDAREISAAEIDAASRQRLLASKSDSVRRRAKLLFGEQASSDRRSVLSQFKDIDKTPADSMRGREVFAQKCAACHALDGKGYAVGPDLAAISDRSTQGLLAAILDPSRAIEPKYALYQAVTSDGRSYTGILLSETNGQIELVEQENRRRILPRQEIEELSSSEKSLMPDGFEKDLTRQQLADLIAYLQGPTRGAVSP